MKIVKTSVPVAAIALLAACGSSQTSQKQAGEEQQQADISFQAALPGASFAGNSVRICGVRGTFTMPDGNGDPTVANETPADAKYRCFNNINDALGVPSNTSGGTSGTPAGMDCPCFTLDQNGMLVGFFPDAMAMGPVQDLPTAGTGGQTFIPNLCPSNDVPGSSWDFTYQIYASGNCSGPVLNDNNNTHNFVCFSSGDLVTQETPNATPMETLVPGDNFDNIVCSTVNAKKTFNFTACALSCGEAGNPSQASANVPVQVGGMGPFTCSAPDENVFECGCTISTTTDMCSCQSGDIPSDCSFVELSPEEPCAIACPVGGGGGGGTALTPEQTLGFLVSSACTAHCVEDMSFIEDATEVPGAVGTNGLPTCPDSPHVAFVCPPLVGASASGTCSYTIDAASHPQTDLALEVTTGTQCQVGEIQMDTGGGVLQPADCAIICPAVMQ